MYTSLSEMLCSKLKLTFTSYQRKESQTKGVRSFPSGSTDSDFCVPLSGLGWKLSYGKTSNSHRCMELKTMVKFTQGRREEQGTFFRCVHTEETETKPMKKKQMHICV
jgi:hypothetical protein